jgi:hypothetical protein
MKHLIVIDDTGSPGTTNETRFFKDDRKTLVAVFIHSDIRAKMEKLIGEVIEILNREFGIKELHFVDLINKQKQYEKFKNDEVIGLIHLLSSGFAYVPLPYFVQTVHKDTLKENGIDEHFKINDLNSENNEDAALIFLTARIKSYIEREYPDQLIEFVKDEGRRKSGRSERLDLLENVSVNSEIIYRSSKEFLLLQIADFFAYSVNRMQITAIKPYKTDYDKSIIEKLSIALSNQYSEGTLMVEIDLDNFTKDDYDYEQRSYRESDSNLDNWNRL